MSDGIKSVTITFNETDLKKLEVLKNRFGYKKNVDIVRYLMTVAIEKILDEPIYKRFNEDMEREYENEHDGQTQRQTKKEKVPIPGVVSAYR